MKTRHPSELSVAVFSTFALAFAAFLEVWGAVCASASLFAGYWLFWTLLLVPFLVRQPSRLKFAIHALLTLSLLVLYLVPWNYRKPFLRDFDKVEIGMTVAEVDAIMGEYMQGTGWRIPPGSASPTGQLTEVSSGITLATSNSPAGELVIRDSITYRHSNDGAFNSDWGVVKFKNGRVIGKRFMPD